MIAVTFALPNESREFVRLLGDQSRNVSVLHTGVGERICRERIGRFLDSNNFEFLISSGFAGGVDPALQAGDLLLAENFSDPELLARSHVISGSQVGKLVTAGAVIESEIDRQQFALQNGAAAVDMETEFIARACAARKLPMLSLRAISDTAAAPFPAPPSVLFDIDQQKTDARKLARHLLRHPSAVVRLVQFARQIAVVRTNLAHGLLRLLGNVSEAR